jgi:hypothetical protein
LRSIALRCFALAGIACGACAHGHDEDSARIEDAMRYELYSTATPGAEGIRLGADAPPLAEVAEASQPSRYGVPGLGYLTPLGRHHLPPVGRVTTPKGPTILR